MSRIIELGGKMFYNTEFVKQSCPAFFYGCAKTLRKIIEKKNIKNDEYTYATFAPKTNKWSVSNDNVKSAKLLLEKTWVENNVPGFGNNDITLDLEMAPPILELKDEEKFKDDKGNIVEIETRGIKTFDGIYFYGKDVEKMLNINDISSLLKHESSSYIVYKHYKKFYRPSPVNHGCKDNESNNHERIYLTYFGLVKMLITTQNRIAESFQKWALQTLFTVQMGSQEEKTILASKLLGCDINSVKSFLHSGIQDYSVLYLLYIGKVKDLSSQLEGLQNKHPDDFVFKYGYTSDLSQRIQTHKRNFEKLKNTNLSLVSHIPIDEKYLSEAEVELKQTFQSFEYIIDNPTHKELVCFNENKLPLFKKLFKTICDKYAGNCKKIQDELEKQQIKHQADIRELELKLKHEQELKNMEKQSKDELTKILMNLTIHFNKQ
jgi:predicted GIY-YIG superfamily endonuclease